MWFEIVFGFAIYKVFKRFLYGDDSDSILDGLDTKHSDVSFSIANRLEKCYGGKAYVGLRIPDPDTSTRQHIEIVLVTRRDVMVVAVRSYSGLVDARQDGSWICIKDSKRTETHPDPVLEVTKQLKILEAYLEQRGVALPKGHLVGRVVLPNPNCRIAHSIDSQPEVIPFEKWKQLQSESKSGFSSWIKDAFHGGKSEMQDGLHQRLNSIFSTSPMWDRLEYKGDRSILGEFIEFQGNQDDMQALRHLKRSKVSQILIQKTTLFGAFDPALDAGLDAIVETQGYGIDDMAEPDPAPRGVASLSTYECSFVFTFIWITFCMRRILYISFWACTALHFSVVF